MHLTRSRLLLCAFSASALVAAAFGCDGLPDKVKYAAPPSAMLQGGCNVTLILIHSDDEHMTARFNVLNASDQPMWVNRDGWALRLQDGRVLMRRGDSHDPYLLQPGQMHRVYVDFQEKGLDPRTVQSASIIVGGISYQNDPNPRVVGEIPITQAGSVD